MLAEKQILKHRCVAMANSPGQEEAGVTRTLASQLQPAGSVSFFHRSERGLHPNTEFVFDLELPTDWSPVNTDGEVAGWALVPANKVSY